MLYCQPGDVAALFKNFTSFTTLTAPILTAAINDACTEIDNVLRNLYRVPLAFNTNAYQFSTTLAGATAAAAVSGTLTAAGTASWSGDSLPFWLQNGDAIFLDPGLGTFERQVLNTINPSTGAFTLINPVGTGTVTYTGCAYAHANLASVVASDSMDLIFLIATRLSFANLVDVYYASSSPKGINEQAATFRHYAEALLSDILSGNTALLDLVAASERPIFPASKGATNGAPTWTGTWGDPGTPGFQKDLGIQYINGEHT